jgi:2-hydroxy-6-oxonona-2,4-dienedioate hydrolase
MRHTAEVAIVQRMKMRAFWRDVCGSRMYAAVFGDGPPIVLVHGYGVSGTYMRPLARALAGSFSTYVPDLPGQGRSGAMRGRTSIRALGEVLGEWVDAVGLVRPAFVANSMGCQIVTQLAATSPGLVGPMVLIGPTIDPSRRGARHQLFGALRDSAREPLSLIALTTFDDASVGIRRLLSTARAVLDDRIEQRLPDIGQPTVVVYGESDGFIGREWAERVAALLPRGRLVVVPREAHAVHYTRPDLIAGIVTALVVEEREHRRSELLRGLEHRDVSARESR